MTDELVRLFHAAPRSARASIGAFGLDSSLSPFGGLPGVYLWPTLELALDYARAVERQPSHPGDLLADVWGVDVPRHLLRPGGPYSGHPSELWTPTPLAGPCELVDGYAVDLPLAGVA